MVNYVVNIEEVKWVVWVGGELSWVKLSRCRFSFRVNLICCGLDLFKVIYLFFVVGFYFILMK